MDTDKILEIARRYTYPDVREDQTFEFDEEDLIAFAHALLEAEWESSNAVSYRKAIIDCINCANGREHEWGQRAETAFQFLYAAIDGEKE